MKKIIALIISVIILCAVEAISFAEENNVFYAADVTAVSGETVQVPVIVDMAQPFASFTIDITYDSRYLCPTEITKANGRSGIMVPNLVYGENTVRSVYASAVNEAAGGELFYVNFMVSAAEDVTTDIKISVEFLGDEGFNNLLSESRSGTVSIIGGTVSKMTAYIETAGDEKYLHTANLSDEAIENVCIYIAGYDNEGDLCDITAQQHTYDAHEKYSQFDINAVKGDVIRVFLWGTDMTPFTEVVTWSEEG